MRTHTDRSKLTRFELTASDVSPSSRPVEATVNFSLPAIGNEALLAPANGCTHASETLTRHRQVLVVERLVRGDGRLRFLHHRQHPGFAVVGAVG